MLQLTHTIYFLLLNVFAGETADSLQFVHVLWRHGDRTPTRPTFPTDVENRPETWSDGLGQLTALGIRQQNGLGAYLRRRYIDTKFLSASDPTEIYVKSSAYNRTIRSAVANLAGFYGSADLANKIRIHTLPLSEDYLINVECPCPEAKRVVREAMQSAFVKKTDSENSEFLRFLSNVTGFAVPSFSQISKVFDPLNCEMCHNRRWPTWVTWATFEKIKELQDMAVSLDADYPKIQRLKGGPIFRDIAHRSQAKAKNLLHPNNLKYYAYSGHDLTISALLKNLGAFDGHLPAYATALIFELHEKAGRHVIKVLYINQTGSENPIPIQVKGCGDLECDLNTFVNLALKSTPADWYAECEREE